MDLSEVALAVLATTDITSQRYRWMPVGARDGSTRGLASGGLPSRFVLLIPSRASVDSIRP